MNRLILAVFCLLAESYVSSIGFVHPGDNSMTNMGSSASGTEMLGNCKHV